jgi:hypothetical protein
MLRFDLMAESAQPHNCFPRAPVLRRRHPLAQSQWQSQSLSGRWQVRSGLR